MAKSWLGTISPRGETTYLEEDCRQIFEVSQNIEKFLEGEQSAETTVSKIQQSLSN
jgi:hypothetical protein